MKGNQTLPSIEQKEQEAERESDSHNQSDSPKCGSYNLQKYIPSLKSVVPKPYVIDPIDDEAFNFV